MKKLLAIILALVCLVGVVGCEGDVSEDPKAITTDFIEVINDSYVNLLRTEATILTYKVQFVDTSKPQTYSEYRKILDDTLMDAKEASSEYLTVVENNTAKVTELYNKIAALPAEYGSIKSLANDMYTDYEYMRECVTDNILYYLSWQEEFVSTTESFNNTMEQLKLLTK